MQSVNFFPSRARLDEQKTMAIKAENAAKYPPDEGRYLGGVGIFPPSLAERVGTNGDQGHNITQKHQPRFRGINYEKRKGVWRARLYYKGEHVTIGRFPTAKLAARAHDRAAVWCLGDRARTNFGIASARAELERALDKRLTLSWSPQPKLVALRELVRKEWTQFPVDEQQARAIRRAAAVAAFQGSGQIQSWKRMLSNDQDGQTNNSLSKSDVCGGELDGSLRNDQHLDAVGAWNTLVLAAIRSA